MRIFLDTNVFVSAVFFDGVPGRFLQAWRDGRLQLVLSAAILDEYQRVGQALSTEYPGVDLELILALLTVEAQIVEAAALPTQVYADPDDDKFLACASAAGVAVTSSRATVTCSSTTVGEAFGSCVHASSRTSL